MRGEDVRKEHRQDDWLGMAMRQAPVSASDACVDAETLAAWVAGGLRGQAAAAVELHASTCSRCMAALAAMERSAPESSSGAVWTPARLFRWLAPLAAAATAVAIWVAVPDRPALRVEPATAHDAAGPMPGTVNPEPAIRNPEPVTPGRTPAPGAQNAERQAQLSPSARVDEPATRQEPLRDDLRRERAATEPLGAAGGAPRTPAPRAAAESSPSAATAAAPQADAAATQTLSESVVITPQQRSAFAGTATVTVTSEAVSPVNQLVRWRVVDSAAIERSTDGGTTWTRTAPISGAGASKPDALLIRGIRAVDDATAIARTSDGKDFVTSDAGRSWLPAVQEKPAAPF